jgi:isoleucyl-tRNA synthetase
VLDVWILEKLQATIGTVTDQLEHYNTVKASRSILDFINDLSTWYVRRSRDRIKAGGDDSIKALQVLGVVLQKTSQILAPFTPFLAETIYRDITGEESVHLSGWPDQATSNKQQATSEAARVFEQMDLVREIVSLGLSARKQAGIPVRQPLQTFAYHLKKEVYLSDEHIALILEELNVKELGDFDSLEEQGQRARRPV